MNEQKEIPMILAWRSETKRIMIPFETVCGAYDSSEIAPNTPRLNVYIGHNNMIYLSDKDCDSFLEAYETYIRIQDVIALGLDTVETTPKKKKETE
tara:strand:+ start:32013 stop:32300 length:288 start_codon:yes stop_codon:yes gene_type:complete